MTRRLLLSLLVLSLLAACRADGSGVAGLPPSTPQPTASGDTGTASGTPQSAEPEENAERQPEVIGAPATLRLWLPPQFAPDPTTPAGALLKERLDAFALLHPGIRITVRIKSETGSGGMVASLSATEGAVPEALPDLILMPGTEMERAVQAGLLHPHDIPLEGDWYPFAHSLATVDDQVFGLPFAADALVMLYRPDLLGTPPRDWTTTLQFGNRMLFAGGSSRALFSLAMYAAAGGRLEDASGQPVLNEALLSALFDFYAQAHAAGVLPELTLMVGSEQAVFEAFQEGEVASGITWFSLGIKHPRDEVAMTGLPTVTSIPFTFARGWMWVLPNPGPDRLPIAAELAAFLTEPEFLSSWTFAAGYLPTRASALEAWPESLEGALASRIVLSAEPLPRLAVLERTGPALQRALAGLLSGELSPSEAAALAVSDLR